MTNKKIMLWGGWYGSKNVGDQALLLAITDLLGKVYPDACFTVLTARPDHVRSYTLRDSKYNFIAINTRKEFPRVVRAFMDCDLFIFGGAAPFFGHAPQVFAIIVLTALARFFRVSYFLWSVSSQRVDSKFTKRIFAWVLNSAKWISCRDEFTRQLFLDCGLSAEKITICGDSVFPMETDPADSALGILKLAGWHPGMHLLVALTPRTLRTADGEAETHYIPKTAVQYQKEIDTYSLVLDWLWEHGYQPLFVPMNTVAPDDDRFAARLIMKQAKHGISAMIVDGEIPPRTASAIYQHCRASLVSRVHGSIMSLKANCPVVMYAFDLKHIGIMQAAGLPDFIFYPEKDAADRAVELLAGILSSEEETRLSLKNKLEEMTEISMIPLREAVRILEGR